MLAINGFLSSISLELKFTSLGLEDEAEEQNKSRNAGDKLRLCLK